MVSTVCLNIFFRPLFNSPSTISHILSSWLVSIRSDRVLVSFLPLRYLAISFPYWFGRRITGIIRTIDDGARQPLEAQRGVEPEEVTAIVEMGFCENVVIEVARAADGDVRQSLETLLR
jgi:hypothetical protein